MSRSSRWVFVGAPTEIRTLVLALKGLRPSPLDDGGKCLLSDGILPLPRVTVKRSEAPIVQFHYAQFIVRNFIVGNFMNEF